MEDLISESSSSSKQLSHHPSARRSSMQKSLPRPATLTFWADSSFLNNFKTLQHLGFSGVFFYSNIIEVHNIPFQYFQAVDFKFNRSAHV